MLKGQSFSSLVKKNNSWAIQADHLNKSPTSIQTRIDPNFSARLEAQSQNPAKKYESQMRSMLRDDLALGMKTHANSVRAEGNALDDRKKHYQQSLDGVLCQLQKNSFTYNLALQKKMNKQEERKKFFVDEDKLKNSRLQSFIHKREDKDVFNRQSDIYQQFQRQEHQNTMEWLKIQRDFNMKNNLLRQKERQKELQKRLLYERQLELKNYQQVKEKLQTQKRYGNELHVLAQERRYRQSIKGESIQAPNRHNPITNPIEFHIENPYFLKRIQQRYNSKH